MQLLTHTCPQCGTVLQYREAAAELPFRCPSCGREDLLPPGPPTEQPIVRDELEEAVEREKKAGRERKRWRRVRLSLTVLYCAGWADLVVVSGGLLAFLHVWFAGLLGGPGAGTGPGALGVIGLLLGGIDLLALAGLWFCRQGPRSAGLQPWLAAQVAVAVPRHLSCFGGSVLLLFLGLPPWPSVPRVLVAVGGVLFLLQMMLQVLLLRAVAHALCCSWLLRRLHNWLFFLATVAGVAAIMLALWPANTAPPEGSEWLGVVALGGFGLMTAALTWLLVAWRVWLLYLTRLVIEA
jgi:hypothetical protein